MASWTPDPTFYPSLRLAAGAPPEKLAYVASFDPARRRNDEMAVVDLDSGSLTYGQIVRRVEMSGVGDELHHFGWNACSSCLCPNMPHPHVERRYLIVPGIRSSRIHILDTKPNPKNPEIVRVLQPAEIADRSGYTRPHTVHCGPDGIYISALGNAEGKAPGGILLMDHETFDVLGRWEVDRGPQQLAYDMWWHLGHDTVITSEWGTPDTFEYGLVPELLLGGKYGHKLHFWDLHRRKHLQEIDLGIQHQLIFELRPAHDPTKAYGFVNCVLSLENLSSSIWTWYQRRRAVAGQEGDRDPGRACRPRSAAADPQGFQGVPTVRHRYRSLGRRQISVRVLLGHRRFPSIRRLRPLGSQADWQAADRRRHFKGAASQRDSAAERRAPDGRGKPRRSTNLLYEFSLRVDRRSVVSGRDPGVDGESRRQAGRRYRVRSEFLCRLASGLGAAPSAPAGRRRVFRFLLLPLTRIRHPAAEPQC
jgi:hypothetical protein